MKKLQKSMGILLGCLALFLTELQVWGSQVNNGTTYEIETNEREGWPEGPETYSETVILMEAETGAILYGKGIDEPRYPASITKIMTALLALEHCSLDEEVTFTEACQADQTWDSSHISMQVGEILTMEQCLYVLMVKSANDVATQIGVHVAGSVESFAQMMNDRAAELGCKNTHFMNASGMPNENHYTTAYDMALIFREAIQHEAFRTIIGVQGYTLEPTNMTANRRSYSTHNALISNAAPEKYEPCFGGKTGRTSAAQSTLVNGAEKNDMTLIAVAMRGAHGGEVCKDHTDLFEYGFQNFKKVDVAGGTVVIPVDCSVEDLQKEEIVDGNMLTVRYYYGEDQLVGQGKVQIVSFEESQEPTSTPEAEMPEEDGREENPDTQENQSEGDKQPLYIAVTVLVFLVVLFIIFNRKRK